MEFILYENLLLLFRFELVFFVEIWVMDVFFGVDFVIDENNVFGLKIGGLLFMFIIVMVVVYWFDKGYVVWFVIDIIRLNEVFFFVISGIGDGYLFVVWIDGEVRMNIVWFYGVLNVIVSVFFVWV